MMQRGFRSISFDARNKTAPKETPLHHRLSPHFLNMDNAWTYGHMDTFMVVSWFNPLPNESVLVI